MASQSMIGTNSTSAKRATFGKLDSMARKVTTTFKEEAQQEAPNFQESPLAAEDNTTQSMIIPNSNSNRPLFGMNKMQ